MSNPNLQNIPIRTEEGKRVREALPKFESPELQMFLGLAFLLEQQAVDLYQRFADENGITRRQAKILLFGELYGKGTKE